MRKLPAALALLLSASFCQFTYADIILNISGASGSSIVNWEATGNGIVVSNAYGSDTSTVGAAPVSGAWDTGFNDNLGDLIINGQTDQLNLVLSGGGISYRRNGVEFNNIITIDLNATATPGGDDIQPDPTGTASYPVLAVGDRVSWSGSGTFTLGGGATFDSYFIQGVTGTSAIDGGSYVVNISAVPEPTSVGILSVGVCLCILRRRKR